MLYFVGDIHGDINGFINSLSFQKIGSGHIIQVGDFGIGFHDLDYDLASLKDLNAFLRQKNNHLFVIRRQP